MKIFKFSHKIHSLFFYKLVRFTLRVDEVFLETPDMGWVINKSLFAILFIQGIWLFILLLIAEIIIGKTTIFFLNDQLISAIVLTCLVSSFNYFTLIYKKKWFKYDEEFATYSKSKNRIINIAIPVFYTLSITLLIIVAWTWANLRHAGKIIDL